MIKNVNRNHNYDLIRVIAIILVVLCHSLEEAYFGNDNTSLQSNLFYILCHSISRLGVPFFLLLTGALLLNKNFERIDEIKKFYKSNLLNLIIVCEFWYIVYFLSDTLIFEKSFYLKDIISILLFLKWYPLAHTWYLPMIIRIYLLIPFISIIVKKHEKYVKVLLHVSICPIFIIPMINMILKMFNISYQFLDVFNILFFKGCYVVYLLIGYFISHNYNNREYKKCFNSSLLIVIFFLSLVFNVFIRYKLLIVSEYNMLTILICSLCLFNLLLKPEIKLLKNYLMTLSICSFGVYLIHKLIIDLIHKYDFMNISNFTLPIQSLLYFLLTIVTSYIIVILISKIKYLKKYILFIRE